MRTTRQAELANIEALAGPTLIFLQDGHEVTRLVRPTGVEAITEALGKLNY